LLIDTGADVTLVPRAAVEKLGAKPIQSDIELIGFDGSRSHAQAVDLDLIFLKKLYRGRYLVVDDEHGVLGRDVLASLILLLDGPRASWDEVHIST
jgi:predicted aspartyl protease